MSFIRFLYPPRPTGIPYGSTSSYFTSHVKEVVRSPDPHAEMHRFAIESIALRDGPNPQLERLCITVSDTKHSPNTRLLCIKSSASDEYAPEYFSEHSDSCNVLDAILSAVEDSLAVISPLASASSSSPIPSRSTCDSDRPPSSVSQVKLVDPVPQTLTPNFYRSVTTVTGHDNRKTHACGQVIRRINPKGLNLFELALLADVVHKHDRLYSLFQNQCYWYVNLICDAVLALYTCKEQDLRGVAYAEDEVFIPPNGRLPKLAGQRKRILVRDMEGAVLSVVLARFEQARKEQMVSFSNALQKKADGEAQRRAYSAKHLEDWQQQLSKLEEIEEACIRQIAVFYEEPKLPDAAERQRQIELTKKQAQRLHADITKEMKSFQELESKFGFS